MWRLTVADGVRFGAGFVLGVLFVGGVAACLVLGVLIAAGVVLS